MSDPRYDETKMSWNEHDKAFLQASVNTVYEKVAEVVTAQNKRFFDEIEKQGEQLEDHEVRIRRLERRYLGKVSVLFGGVLLGSILLAFIIL